MTHDVLLGPWLEPATDFKAPGHAPHGGERSPRGRRRLGSKGVGRFAAQRLGGQLLVRTRWQVPEPRWRQNSTGTISTVRTDTWTS